jgi:uncharacterized membrane protein YphA (DoxX/SURF4 family)
LKNFKLSIINNSWIELAARWILGLTFIYASFHKILSPEDFAKIVYGYDLFPHVLINLIAIMVPLLELVAGLALLIGFYTRSAAIIINVMLLAFVAALTINIIRGHEFDCGCFAVGQNGYSSTPKMTLVRDIFYFVCGMLIILFEGNRKICFDRIFSK